MTFQKPVYLDNSTTARPSDEAVSRMLSFYTDKWGVLTQAHRMGQELFTPFKEALQSVYKLLSAHEKDTVILTSSGAEAINQAILSTYQDVSLPEGKNHFITLSTEDAPFLMSLNRLKEFGAATTLIKPDSKGILSLSALTEAITPRTALVAVSWANGLTGVIQPIHEIASLCRLRGIRLLVDATYVLGKLFFNLNEYPIDFLSFNGDPLHAPKGTGGLYIREGIRLSPFITGGIEQMGLRAGAVNMPATVALGIAARQCLEARDYFCTEIARLKFQFEQEILKGIPQAKVLFGDQEKVPGILTVAFPGIINEALLFALNRQNVMATLGGGSQMLLSHYLKTCGFENKIADSALSFSLSRETREEDIERAVEVLKNCVSKLYKISKHLFEPS